jgi:hypothetical protein
MSISFNINADDKLKAVFNSKLKGSMFEMTALRQPRVRPYRYSRFNPDFVLIFGAGGAGGLHSLLSLSI